MLKSLFYKVADREACNFIKKRLQNRCFPVNIVKFLRTPIWPYFEEHLRTAASELTLGSDSLGTFSGQSLSKPFRFSNITKIPVAFKPEL